MSPPTDQTKPEYTLKGRHGYYSRVISSKPIRCEPAIALHDDVYIKRCLRATIWLLLQPSDQMAISKL